MICKSYYSRLAILDTMEKATTIARLLADSNIGFQTEKNLEIKKIRNVIFL